MTCTRISITFLTLALIVGCSKTGPGPEAPGTEAKAAVEPASHVFRNAKVYTVNDEQPWAEALVVRGKQIVYVGGAAGTDAFVGDATQVHDLAGKMVLPGFVSGHDHLIASNWTKAGVSLFGAASKEEVLARIRDYADQHPDEKFVFGYGWDKAMLGGNPTAKELDGAVRDRPAMIFDFTIHDLWFNTKALEAAGITKETEDVQPGFSYWVRDRRGNPTGVGVELTWTNAFVAAGAWDPEVLVRASQQALYETAVSDGWTSVINQGLVTPNVANLPKALEDVEASFALLEELDSNGKLKLRTFQNLIYKNPNDSVDLLVESAVELRAKYDSDRVRALGIKIHPEGNWVSYTALMLENYADKKTKGQGGVPPERVAEIVAAANAKGIDVAVHTDGSATHRTTLDAFEASIEAGHGDARNSLQHYINPTPEDQERAAKIPIGINVTPLWATNWGNNMAQALPKLGKKRIEEMYQPIRRALDAGARVSISSDVPSTPAEDSAALIQLESAVALVDPTNPDDEPALDPSKAITLEQGIKALTIYPAWQARMEDKIGTLEVGKYADLVILEKNLFDVAPTDIADVKVLATMMDGRFTYGDAVPTSTTPETP